MTSLHALAAALLALGLSAALALTGGDFWPFALAWLGAALALVVLRSALARARPAWMTVTVLAVLVCPPLTFEGGMFVLPAALAFALAEVIGGGRGSARHRVVGQG